MKKTLITIGAAAAGFVLSYLLKKQYQQPNDHSGFETKHQVSNHHLTNVFAKAKKVAVADI